MIIRKVSLRLSGAVFGCVVAGLVPGSAFAQTAPDTPVRVPVQTVDAKTQDVPVVLHAIGQIQAYQSVLIRARVDGTLDRIAFTEGQEVKAGDLLAEIDPRPYQAALDQVKARRGADEAQMTNAKLDLQRYSNLARSDFASRQSIDTQTALVQQYQANLAADDAAIETATLNLGFTRITAPIDGRVGLRQVDPGNYVTASDSSGIVVVTEIAPISVVFVLAEDKVPAVRARLKAGASLPVAAYDRANAAKLAEGRLATLDNQLDTTTGTLKLRAVFANGDDLLFPNQFVNARLLLDTLKNVVTLPQSALQTGADGRTVYVVDDQNKVHLRKVETGISNAGMVVVTRGLEGGERVVTDGIDRLADGAPVTIVDAGRS